MVNAEYMNKIENVYSDGGQSIIDIPSLDYFDAEQYDIYDQKDYARMIKDIETGCRMSFEYRQLIAYLRNTEGMNVCSFLGNVTNVDNTKVKIEIHHGPLSLFDYVSSVVKKRLHNGESIDIFEVCKEIMLLHYIGWVGLIPVSATVHEMIHNQYIFVPTNIVRGNWRKFIEEYYDFIDPAVLDSVDVADEMTKEWLDDQSGMNNQVDAQQQLFNLHATYIRYNNIDIKSNITPSKNNIKESITELKTKKKKMFELVDNTNYQGPISKFLSSLS